MRRFSGIVLAVGMIAVPLCVAAQDEGPANVRIIVRAEGKGDATPAALSPATLKLELNGKPVAIDRVVPLVRASSTPEVALLIDDGLRANFGIQLREVEDFVRGTTAEGVAVGVGYMRNGSAQFPAGFSTDAERELGAVRLPISTAGVDGSPYFCLQDLVKHWPTNTNAPRVVLMITDGIDRYNGSVSPLNQDSPYVQSAQDDAQRGNVPVYSIYYGRRELNANLPSFSGQSYLSQVADATGGKLFNGGQINPPTLTPYFREFDAALHESYLVGFTAAGKRLERLKVSSTTAGVKLHTQKAVQATTRQE